VEQGIGAAKVSRSQGRATCEAGGLQREGRKEFAQFTRIAKASNAEGRADLHLALGRGLLTQDEFDRLHAKNLSIARMLRRLHQSLTRPRT
jgi:four helix bundle protein